MPAIHNERHPLAGTHVEPVNPEILAKFGKVRVDDWQDRIAGEPWEASYRGGQPEAADYRLESRALFATSGNADALQTWSVNEVVRCHDAKGNPVLLHDAWLRNY